MLIGLTNKMTLELQFLNVNVTCKNKRDITLCQCH